MLSSNNEQNGHNKPNLSIKVTNINNQYHARLFLGDKIIDEMSCCEKIDIGWICREMLRWYDKSFYPYSKFASKSRERQSSSPIGKVQYIGI